jgi:hypothetical protein
VGYFSPGIRSRSGGALVQQPSALTMLGRGAVQSDGAVAGWSGHFRGVQTPSTSGHKQVRFGPHCAHQMQPSPSVPKRKGPSIPKDFQHGAERCRVCLESVARADGLCPASADGHPLDPRMDARPGWMLRVICGGAAKHFDSPFSGPGVATPGSEGSCASLSDPGIIKSTFWASQERGPREAFWFVPFVFWRAPTTTN